MNKLLLLSLFAAACGGGDDSSDTTKTVDAAKTVDGAKTVDASGTPDAAATATVTAVDCSTVTPAGTVTTAGFAFSPAATTVAQNGVVKFTMPSEHNVVPDSSTNTDPGLTVDFNETKCLKFTAKGTFGFKCLPHGFKGSVTVN